MMTRISLISLICLIGLTSCRSPIPSPADLAAQAYAIDKQIIYSFNAGDEGDLDGFMLNYWNSEELVVVDVNKFFNGYVSWREAISKQLKARGQNKFIYTESHNSVQGSYVIGSGKWQYIAPKEGGAPEVTDGIYTDVKALRNGRLVLIAAHFSKICKPCKSE